MLHRFSSPTPPLSSCVAAFWQHQSEPQARSRVLPTGTAQLVIDLSGAGLRVPDPAHPGRSHGTCSAVLHGADSVPFPLETDHPLLLFGVDFQPGGAYPFFAPSANELQNAHIPLDALWSARLVAELSERLAERHTMEERAHILERTLVHQLVRPLEHHGAVALALRAFSFPPQRDDEPQPVRIAQVAEAAGLSRRRLTRLFGEEVGLTPKEYARVRRFCHLLRRIHERRRVNWAWLAVECGYYDQAHLINEFRTFAGVCPSVYLRTRDMRSPSLLPLTE
jgi:AraC-like DNA-binding protein